MQFLISNPDMIRVCAKTCFKIVQQHNSFFNRMLAFLGILVVVVFVVVFNVWIACYKFLRSSFSAL